MLQKIVKVLGGDPHKKEIERCSEIVSEINALEEDYEKLSDDALRGKTDEFKDRLSDGETLDDLLIEAFATVREASKRTIGLRHYDVQMIGGITLHEGKIAEMRTGEGKTLVATLPLYLNALTGKGTHLVTVNDYLARRDARWMAPIYHFLGLSVGVLQMATKTENGSKAFLINLEHLSPFEDQNQLVMVDRKLAYAADITYGTNNEFGFDYLRDNLTNRLEDRVQRGHYYVIIDEVDNILIDEARTPLIISGPASDDTAMYAQMAQIVRQLRPEDYEISERDRTVTLNEIGESHVEELLGIPLRDPTRPEDISQEQARISGYLEQSLKAQFLYRRNKDYLVQGGKVVIVDEFTGRLMPGRRWSEGLHQAVEAKEGVKVEPENVTYATITIQNYFRMYEKISGMTGTALTESEEFDKIYKLAVLPIPTNLEYSAFGKNAVLETVEAKDEQGYKYTYYARKDDTQKKPVFYKRKDFPDLVYRTEEAKLRAIVSEIVRYYVLGRPQLVGTTSVEHSDRLSDRLSAESVRRLVQTQLIHDAWLEKNEKQVSEQAIPELAFLWKPIDQLNTGEMRQIARSVGLNSISPEDPNNLERAMSLLELPGEEKERLIKVFQGGVPHEVLNARKHDAEAMIIQKAGAFGAVTIATNMAGRGVDIKLGGELSDEIQQDVIRVLSRYVDDPYNMNDLAKQAALLQVPKAEYGIYEESINAFLEHLNNMKHVRELGGLHVVGSERHEARRIDNQLRGRSSRQGDPGSSRFYLSLEDELMRLFGGQQVEGLMRRLNIDESVPIESGIVGRLVEQSQERVEGANFDVRKHLLEYDDVLNSQRKRIYSQRDRVFTKEDLTEDVMEMLESDLKIRVEQAKADEEGSWKLLYDLEKLQPSIDYEGIAFPSFPIKLLVEEVLDVFNGDPIRYEKLRPVLLSIAEKTFEAEHVYLSNNANTLLINVEDQNELQLKERYEALDTFMEGLEDRSEAENPPKAQELLDELSNLVRTPLRLSNDLLRQLPEGTREVEDEIRDQIETFLMGITNLRLIGTFARRIDNFDLQPTDLQNKSWKEVVDTILEAVDQSFERKSAQLFGNQGQIARDLDAAFEKIDVDSIDEAMIMRAFLLMTQGLKVTFDKKTHRQGWQRFVRLNYAFYAAKSFDDLNAKDMLNTLLDHYNAALEQIQKMWGVAELNRLHQSEICISQLDEKNRNFLEEWLGSEKFAELLDVAVADLDEPARSELIKAFGWRMQNEINRELLLSVISQSWVEYLTKVEALRVSIGLEAYAQRDPLVQYKSQATEMFKDLLNEIRNSVVTRMFTFQPSRAASASSGTEKAQIPSTVTTENGSKGSDPQKKKARKRH